MNSNSKQRGTYFQVPLCAFAFGQSHGERLDAIISFGLVETGLVCWRGMANEKRADLCKRWSQPGQVPRDYNPGNKLHIAALYGATVIGVNLVSLRATQAQYEALCRFRDEFVSRHGPEPLVRLKRELIFEARDGNGVTPRELGVLAGIYSVIGNKRRPVLITQDRIRWRALGYKTKAVLDCELHRRPDGAKPLTGWQLRSIIGELHTRKFFRRATYGCRLTYYSHRMNEREFSQALIEMKTYKFSSRMLRRADDAELTDAIRNHRAATVGKPPPAPHAKPLIIRGGFLPEDAGPDWP